MGKFIFDEVRSYLLDSVNIAAKVGGGKQGRVYYEHIRQDQPVPMIRIELFTGFSQEHLAGIAGLAQQDIQIDCYDETPKLAWDLAELVRLRLQQYRGTMSAAYVRSSADSAWRSGVDPPARSGDAPRYWVSRDFTVTYPEDTA